MVIIFIIIVGKKKFSVRCGTGSNDRRARSGKARTKQHGNRFMASHGPHGNTTMHRSQVRKVL
jgi:hypothetical protein